MNRFSLFVRILCGLYILYISLVTAACPTCVGYPHAEDIPFFLDECYTTTASMPITHESSIDDGDDERMV